MGAVGCNDTNINTTRQKETQMRLTDYDFGPYMVRRFVERRHTCADRHKRVTRDSGAQEDVNELEWVQGDKLTCSRRKIIQKESQLGMQYIFVILWWKI